MKIYVVTENWYNGGSYEDRDSNYRTYLKAFSTKEKAIEYINNMVLKVTAPYEYEEPEHDRHYESNVKFNLQQVENSKIESEILRKCFDWNDDKTVCVLDTKTAYEEIEKAGCHSYILDCRLEFIDLGGELLYRIKEDEME